jgi:hypothetical protein
VTEESVETNITEESVETDTAEQSVEAALLDRATIKRQLRAGFREVGRTGLVRMVSTDDFSVWVNQESGWNPRRVSGRTNQGKVNGGLFQYWYGHRWAQKYFSRGNDPSGAFTMTPKGQAVALVHHFPHVTPARIRGFAQQIRNGTYQGWG